MPAVLSIDLYKKNRMSHTMGFLIFSCIAVNHVKRNISFVAFYYRFFVAIKMLLKLIDVNVPFSPIPHLYSLPLISGKCAVINRHEQGRACSGEGRLQGGVSSTINTNQKCIQTQREVSRELLCTCKGFPTPISWYCKGR